MSGIHSSLPHGTVTFLFTDVEGSTRLLDELGAEAYAAVLAEHRRVIRDASAAHGGVEVDTQGDAFFFAFPTAPGALEAARATTEALVPIPIRVRIGLHTGTPLAVEEGYVGADVHRAARVAAAGHGGQVLLSSSTASLVEADILDLGEHRLMDLSAPEHLYQLGECRFPPLKTLYQTNLPVATTPFIGRDVELREAVALLAREDVRLLTLTGPGGTGKTRLAFQVAAAEAERYEHGVWWVRLELLRDPKLVLDQAAQVLGAKRELADHIRDQRTLLLFDNFEHVIEARADLAKLVAACPNLRALVTSREPLHLTGEQEYPVPPLTEAEAIQLFHTRAQAAVPGFGANGAVAEICNRLDCLPLAVELAAARVKALEPEAILERLEQRLPLLTGGPRDAPRRQRTLRATIQWSYDLLAPEEQRLFAALSVFVGGCTLEAAEKVCDATVDLLGSLVDKSLVRPRDGRYWMLETIREYAAVRLEERGDADDLRRAHAVSFALLAERAELQLRSAETLAALSEDEGNLRAALSFCAGGREPELMLRMAGALWRFWDPRSQHEEGRRWLEEALQWAETGVPSDSPNKADALRGLAMLTTGDDERSLELLEDALALYRRLGDDEGVARCLNNLGVTVDWDSDLDRAKVFLEESLVLTQRLAERGTGPGLAVPLGNLARMAAIRGDVDEWRRLAEQTLAASRSERDDLSEAVALIELAWIAALGFRFGDAARLAGEVLRSDLPIAAWRRAEDCLLIAALVHASRGNREDAARLVGAAAAHRENLGLQELQARIPQRVFLYPFATLKREVGEERYTALYAEGAALSFDDALELAARVLE